MNSCITSPTSLPLLTVAW